MKNPLTKTEITGLALLGTVVAGITATGILLKRCGDEVGEIPAVEIVAVDTVPAPAPTRTVEKERKNKGRKKKSASRKKEVKKKAVPARDPFADTIPVTK